ncbi:MAG: hypothetical protein HY786_06570 [Deltaproteobacteria bacterium]|nr:hypothetical protein [Deltaproteobacteria bacterium]
MKVNSQKSEVRSQKSEVITIYLLPLTLSLLSLTYSLLFFTGCGESVTGTNAELDAVHIGGPDCAQSGCHPGIGAAGTVFTDMSGETPVSGVTVKAQSISTGTVVTLGTSDILGNFHYHEELSGYYNMAAGSKPWSRPHSLPDWNGCNSCHRWPPAGGAYGNLN